MGFQGKVILITGGSSGIGSHAGRHLAQLGASVALVGRNEARLNQVAEQIKSDGSPTPLAIVADVTKEPEKIINETISHFNKLDVLINNAGIFEISNFGNLKMEVFDRIIDTNLRSIIRLTQLAVSHLSTTKGNIVNVSSVAGLKCAHNAFSYCISKAALNHFTKCISLELAPKGIRVNAINPAAIETPIFKTIGMTDEQIGNLKKFTQRTYPLGRIGCVEDTSNAMAFLANDAASFITGVLLPVDGGYLNIALPENS